MHLRPDGCSFHALLPQFHRKPGSAFRGAALFAAAACLAIAPGIDSPLRAQSPAQTSHATQGNSAGKLKLVVILSRHGVRSPTWTNERLDAYSAQPWPAWSVPPGYLTGHGYELIKQFGSFDRISLAQAGLISASGCADAANTYISSDTDQRTIESGRALAEGLFPGCAPAVHGGPAGERDLLFHPAFSRDRSVDANAGSAGMDAGTQKPDAQQSELIEEMQRVLLGCSANAACTPAHAPEISLLGDSPVQAHRKGDGMGEPSGPLAAASSFAEDFLLEYADGMPMDRVGWGNVDEALLRRLLALHTVNFDQSHRTPAIARLEASNMLFRIERTLGQAVEQQPLADALGPVGSKVVILVGHDSNLAAVAALLGLHWTLDGRTDDTPPGTELAFELWQDSHGMFSVRVTVAMQTLRQMRGLQDLNLDAPPALQTLTLEGCEAEGQTCRWKDFQHIADAAIDMKAVLPQKPGQL